MAGFIWPNAGHLRATRRLLLCYLLPAGVDERLSLAFEIGLEWVVCHKTGLSTTFNWIPSTMPGKRKIKPQVEGLSIFEKGGHGCPHRVKRSKLPLFVARGQLNVYLRAGTDLIVC